VKNAEDVQKSVEAARVGSNLQVELRRNQKDIDVTVQPGALPTQRK
jgi:S1-C subfamily serine protease